MTDDHRGTVDSNRLIVSYKIVLAKSKTGYDDTYYYYYDLMT